MGVRRRKSGAGRAADILPDVGLTPIHLASYQQPSAGNSSERKVKSRLERGDRQTWPESHYRPGTQQGSLSYGFNTKEELAMADMAIKKGEKS